MNAFSNLGTTPPDKPVQSDALVENLETMCRAFGWLMGRILSTFIGTFAAGLVLLLMVHLYVEYKISVMQRNVNNALQKMDVELKQLDAPFGKRGR